MIITQAKGNQDLIDILRIQKQNLKSALTAEEARAEGFITVPHNLEILKEMNDPFPHTIAREGENLAGYALVMLKSMRNSMPILVPMFQEIDMCMVEGKALADIDYFAMGQVCIAKGYRGQGLFQKMYDDLCTRMSESCDYIATEIAADNFRSQKAHANYGFATLNSYTADGVEWLVVGREIESFRNRS